MTTFIRFSQELFFLFKQESETEKQNFHTLELYCPVWYMLNTNRDFQMAQWQSPPANAGDAGSIPEQGRSPGEGNGNPLQCSCLGNPMDRGVWRATVDGIPKEQWAQLTN